MALKRMAEKYGDIQIGRFAISQGHTNYVENERILHEYYAANRQNDTELFSIALDDVIPGIQCDLVFKDETKEIEKRAENF